MQLHRGEYPNLPKKASDEFLLEFIKVNTKGPSPPAPLPKNSE